MASSEYSADFASELVERGFVSVPMPPDLLDSVLDLVMKFYAGPVTGRVGSLASEASGILGYYPSEREAAQLSEAGVELPTFGPRRARGYSSFDFMAEDSLVGSSPVIKANAWPSDGGDFEQAARECYGALASYASAFTRSLLSDLVKKGWIDQREMGLIDGPCCSLMRLLHYDAEAGAIESKPHTDYELISFIISPTPGLHVRSQSGRWERPSSPLGHAVLLPGDMLEAVTKGRIESSLHKVRCEGGERFSVVFFQGLPLSAPIDYRRAGISCPPTFGRHMLPLLLRGAAHLQGRLDDYARDLGGAIPESNMFKVGKIDG